MCDKNVGGAKGKLEKKIQNLNIWALRPVTATCSRSLDYVCRMRILGFWMREATTAAHSSSLSFVWGIWFSCGFVGVF